MATLPLSGEVTFEDGTLGAFDSETDTDGRLNVRHYSDLARFTYPDFIPWRGAFCAHIDLSVAGGNDAYYTELSFLDTAASGTIAVRFYFYATALTMAASDRFNIFAIESVAGTNEASVSVLNNAGTIQLVFAETGAIAVGAATRLADLIQSQWHCIELVCVLDSGVGNDGTITAYLDGQQVLTAITALDQGAIVSGRLGVVGLDAGTTRGHLLFDQFAADTARIGPLARRFDQTRVLTQSGHAVLGPASILEADILLSSANDETMAMYDTDNASILDISKRVAVFNSENPIYVEKGLYCVLGGTSPVAFIKVQDCRDMNASQIVALGLKSSP